MGETDLGVLVAAIEHLLNDMTAESVHRQLEEAPLHHLEVAEDEIGPAVLEATRDEEVALLAGVSLGCTRTGRRDAPNLLKLSSRR